jgi:hypothetical protein
VTLPSSTQSIPAAGGHPEAPPQLQPAQGLYEGPQAALKSIRDDYSYWTSKLTESSFALSLAVIGANWAVFGSVDRVLNNIWAELSIAAVILSLVISLIGHWFLGGQLRKRIAYAEQDTARWQKEFNENAGKSTPWPSTERIDRLAAQFRFLKTFLPVLGGSLFLIALFTIGRGQRVVIDRMPTIKTVNITAVVFGFIGAALVFLDSWRISTRFSDNQLEVGFPPWLGGLFWRWCGRVGFFLIFLSFLIQFIVALDL